VSRLPCQARKAEADTRGFGPSLKLSQTVSALMASSVRLSTSEQTMQRV
jgi:hypothetical protein